MFIPFIYKSLCFLWHFMNASKSIKSTDSNHKEQFNAECRKSVLDKRDCFLHAVQITGTGWFFWLLPILQVTVHQLSLILSFKPSLKTIWYPLTLMASVPFSGFWISSYTQMALTWMFSSFCRRLISFTPSSWLIVYSVVERMSAMPLLSVITVTERLCRAGINVSGSMIWCMILPLYV